MRFEHQRKALLRHLDRAEFDSASGMPFADGGEPVAGRRSATTRPSLEHVPDEAPAVARIHPIQRDAQTAAPAAHRTLRARRRQRNNDCLDDFV